MGFLTKQSFQSRLKARLRSGGQRLFKSLGFLLKSGGASPAKDGALGPCAINKEQLRRLVGKNIFFACFLVDSLSPEIGETNSALFKKAEHKQPEEVLSQTAPKDKSLPIVIVCQDGRKSAQLARALTEKGFLNACFLEGGFKSLREEDPA